MASRQSARTARNLAPGGRLSEQSRSIGPCWSPRGFREPPKPALDSPSPGEYQRDERASDRRVARPRVKPRLSKTAALARRPLHTTAARCHSYYLPVWLQLVQVTPRWIQLNQLPEEKAISEWQERQARPTRAKLSNPSVQQLGRLQGSGQRPGSPRGAIQRCAWRRP